MRNNEINFSYHEYKLYSRLLQAHREEYYYKKEYEQDKSYVT